MQVTRYDRAEITDSHLTDEGYLDIKACPISRSGVFPYYFADGTMLREAKLPNDLQDGVDSFNNKPVTNEHPNEFVTADNISKYSVGMTHSNAHMQDGKMVVDMTITDPTTIKEIHDGKRRELSIGFKADVEKRPGEFQGQHYDAVQTNIQGNHVAVVSAGRAGHDVRVPHFDSKESPVATEIMDAGYAGNLSDDKGGKILKTMIIDGKPYELAEDAAAAVQAEQNKATTGASSLEEANKTIAALKKQIESLKSEKSDSQDKISANQAKADAAQSELQNMKDSQQALIDARVQLQMDASKRLDDKFDFKGKSNRDIKAAVILANHKDLKLDDKDDVYVDGAYSLIMAEKPKSIGGIDVQAGQHQDGEDPKSAAYKFAHAYEIANQE
ncbi:DUF2213 domain-containing protein [Lactiplantibacillus mudanjiangensis]|uniref:DUF2213 domain-containing protein n=1 Tax=Lactiplantibacillus mudanjiangensis TaxID=1296538 RepID=A0A660DXP7_9LACO|nr:DUF2213 domain-containing protein [Lactiplantibacillus mudanjiangensis]VDG23674.1 hypothetical protein MUDAN_IGPPGNFN_02211 [Lactiplantibacillus mudanjiangensis]VDG27817.1 hypothetical protein MUDAN_MDHGFNIF_02640 [Lactiplantibacillus mudanjiangensis]